MRVSTSDGCVILLAAAAGRGREKGRDRALVPAGLTGLHRFRCVHATYTTAPYVGAAKNNAYVSDADAG